MRILTVTWIDVTIVQFEITSYRWTVEFMLARNESNDEVFINSTKARMITVKDKSKGAD